MTARPTVVVTLVLGLGRKEEEPSPLAKGEKAGAMGVVVSWASADYNGGGARLDIKLVDIGSLAGPLALRDGGVGLGRDRS